MALPQDDVTRKRLMISRHLYLHGLGLDAPRKSSIERIIAVIVFDLAIESLMRTLIAALNKSKTPAHDFPGLIQQANSELASTSFAKLPDKPNIHHVHLIRNDCQHKARYPSEADVQDCRTYTRDFLTRAMLEYWGTVFDSISLSDLIQDDKVRRLVKEAELARGAGNFEGSVKKSAEALAWALTCVRTEVVGDGLSNSPAPVGTDGRPAPDLTRTVEKLQETTLCLALGLDQGDLLHFRSIAGDTHFLFDEQSTPYQPNAKAGITEKEADEVLAIATQAVLQIEDRVGSLDKPYGRDR